MENTLSHLIRYTKPTDKDKVPYGTRWTFEAEDESTEEYIQISQSESNPKWIRLGLLIEHLIYPLIQDKSSIVRIIEMYKNKEMLDSLHLIKKNEQQEKV